MAAQVLTELFVNKVTAQDVQKEYRDCKVPGLALRVSPGGRKTFTLWYRLHGKAKRKTIGRAGLISLADARRKARQVLVEASNGIDFGSADSRNASHAPKFELLVEEFIESHAKRHIRSWKQSERILRRVFSPHWQGRFTDEITKANIKQVCGAIESPSSANRAFAAVRKLFNWAVEQDYLESSPAAGLKNPHKSYSRDRVLSGQELFSVWNATEAMGYPYGMIVQLLILTAQRRTQVSGMRWDELDLVAKTWTLSGERMKMGHKHVVPLTEQCVSILKGIPRTDDSLVFPATGGDNPVSGFSKWKRQLDQMSGVKDWTIHDLRRTAATGMAQLSVPPHVVEKLLHHTAGSTGGVAGIYNRYGYLNEMRDALEAWSKHVKSQTDR